MTKQAKPQPRKHERNVQSHVRTRAVASAPTSISEDGRSFDIVIYTEHPVRTRILDPRTGIYIEADEVLLASGLDLSMSPRMPLVNNHNSFGDIRSTNLGRIYNVRAEGTQVVGRTTLAHLHKDLAPDIAEGNIGNISATYYATDYEIQERENDVPLATAHTVYLLDGSLVPVGADPNASVRGQNPRTFPAPKLRGHKRSEEKTMDELETAIAAAEEALAAVDEAVEAAGDTVTEDLAERVKKLRAAAEEETAGDAAPADEGEGARAEGDEELTAEEQKKEDEEIRSIRSLASTYGLAKTVDDLAKLGARAADIKVAVRSAVLKRGAAPAASTPAAVKPAPSGERSSAVDTAAIYARRNKR